MDVRLEVRHLRLLSAIAEEGSVTRAGRRLNLTQSALSHQLRDAEERLETPLFLRIKKKMVLTPAGEGLLASGRRILDELRRAEARVRDFSAGGSGTLRLSTECYTVYHWLPPVLKAFSRKFPKVEVRIELEATRRTIGALLEGKLDVAIVSSEPRDRSLRLHPLFEDDMLVVLSADHPLARRDRLRPRDLATETVLVYPPKEDSLLLGRVLEPAGVAPAAVLEVPLTEAILEMAAASVGIGFLARWAIGSRLRAGLVARPITRGGFRRRWAAATLRSAPLPAYVEEFLRLLTASTERSAARPRIA